MKCVCFGEIMGRLSPTGFSRFVQAENFEMTYGGSEANVAVSLANFGLECAFVTRLPQNDIAESALRMLRAHGVDTLDTVRGGERMGLYFYEKGASQRHSRVIYDRKNSSFATASLADYNWNEIFADADWFHFSGISPALSSDCAEICLAACRAAKEQGLTVSLDMNYRKNLWNTEKAANVMQKLLPFADIAFVGKEDCENLFGVKADEKEITNGKLSPAGYQDLANRLCEKYGLAAVAFTFRESISANENNWSAMLYENGEAHYSRRYALRIVDRVGGGDSFAAGLIYALKSGKNGQEAVEFATAASALKHSIEGDCNEVTVAEVEALAAGDGSGRVQR